MLASIILFSCNDSSTEQKEVSAVSETSETTAVPSKENPTAEASKENSTTEDTSSSDLPLVKASITGEK